MRRLTLVVLLLAAGCSPSRDGAAPRSSSLLEEPKPQPIQIEAAAKNATELRRTLTAPHRDTARALGSHRFQGTNVLRVSENGQEVEALDEKSGIEVAGDGAFHARYENSRDYGREVFSQGETIWIRPRYGKYHRRPATTADEPLRVLDEIYASFGADYDLVAPAAAITDEGAVQVAGRTARRLKLSLGEAGRRPAALTPDKAWRDSVTVQALAGEVALDVATGALLQGRLEARVAFVRGGRSFDLALTATHAITDVGSAVPITTPPDAETVTTLLRAHDFEDREDLLHGLAPPARRAPTPGDR